MSKGTRRSGDLVESSCREVSDRGLARRSRDIRKSFIEIAQKSLLKGSCGELM